MPPNWYRPIGSLTPLPGVCQGAAHRAGRHHVDVTSEGGPGVPSVLQRLRTMTLELAEGERLPPERLLAEELGVARMTIRRAIAALAREGLVRTLHGSGNVRVPDAIPLRVGLGSFATAA